jgi:hypothetical protein
VLSFPEFDVPFSSPSKFGPIPLLENEGEVVIDEIKSVIEERFIPFAFIFADETCFFARIALVGDSIAVIIIGSDLDEEVLNEGEVT